MNSEFSSINFDVQELGNSLFQNNQGEWGPYNIMASLHNYFTLFGTLVIYLNSFPWKTLMLGKQSSVDSIREKMTSFISWLVGRRKSDGPLP